MIEINELLMTYGTNEVLNIRSLSLDEGVSYGIVGHNGAGKTTLFKCITNIIMTYRGSIKIMGENVKERNEILTNVGLVLDGMSVYTNQTGWFNIQYFAGLRGDYNEERVRQLAADLDLYGVLDQKVKTYSYGMQKKLILLIALIHTPKILILDEPFRGLDIDTVRWFKDYLKQLTKEGLTLLISSHVINDLEELCDEVYVVDRGRISEHIDLKTEKARQYRLIDTTNNTRLIEILEENIIPFEMKDERIKLDIDSAKWGTVYQQLQNEGIEINEMSRVKVLEEKLN
ncbi:ABC transporter ATP-binding protein [Isobaculum melis]|uniref:ABC-2 type transport system ATP-binding protein n=1 Tax=Isobaculum melis TaxID=142588 RepID=A0A1H9U7H9_9LACT|nr:ABC transporter ATP-binding protein [Isobaculum melis]SES05415.1 ABC-2 type transport system ATP-binding protein [Isobaculum melis]